jgi:hypothetical protein
LDGAGTGSAADASGCGGVSTGNAAADVGNVYVMSDAADVGAGDASSVALGTGKASFVPKTNSSIALPSGLRFLILTSTLPQFPQQSVLFFRI